MEVQESNLWEGMETTSLTINNLVFPKHLGRELEIALNIQYPILFL